MTAIFDEILLPTDVRWGVKGGPEFSTTVLETTEGFEFRNRNWSQPLRSWDVGYGVKFQDELDVLVDFFKARGGRERGFLFKDWGDYKHDMSLPPSSGIDAIPLAGGNFVLPGGVWQLYKPYADDGATHCRPIQKPVPGTVVITTRFWPPNYNIFTATEDADYTVDYTSGVVTWTSEFDDTGATGATGNPMPVTTSSPHGLSTGQSVFITLVGAGYTTDAVGPFGLNFARWPITVTGGSTFTIDGVNCTVSDASTFTVDGEIEDDEVVWAEFDFYVPVRFDNDTMQVSIDSFMFGEGKASHGYTWKKVGITEIRDPLPLAYSENPLFAVSPEVEENFHEVQFDPEVAYKALGGPGFKTLVFTGHGGVESRTMNWDQQKAKYLVSHNLKTFDEYIVIHDFFHARWGKAFGFRFKDWADYKHDMSDTPSAILVDVGDGTVGPWQLTKIYTSDNDFVRKIRKVVLDTQTITLVGPLQTYTASNIVDEDYDKSPLSTTGLLTWRSGYTEANVTVTPGNPTQITTIGDHGIDNSISPPDGSVYCRDATGTGASLLNDIRHEATYQNAYNFTIPVNTTALTVSDLFISVPPDPDETIYWEGEFDVPVRFDTDSMDLELQNYGIFTWGKIKLVEIRQD